MKGMGVDILLAFGDTGDVGLRYGNLRYLTNFKIIFGNSALVFPLNQEPIMFMSGGLQAKWAKQLSWINDVRDYQSNLISDLVNTLKSKWSKAGRIGIVSLASLPLSWYQTLRQEFPSVDLIEMGPVIQEMRYIKGYEEIEMVERAAQLADKGFKAILEALRPGMTDFEVIALLERPMREEGGEDFFNLIFSGPFGPGTGMLPFAPTGKKVKVGDSLLFEITPRYVGYWAQLVRVVDVGRQNLLLADYHRVSRDAIEAAIQYFKPGVRLSNALNEAKRVIESAGFEFRSPFGHICGLDLIESRISLESEDILKPGMVIILHPPICSENTMICWGETYLITSEGYRRLHRATDELVVVS
jgi:Xaa-Pro aminopeptidase